MGVERGLAGVKFSGSVRRLGKNRAAEDKEIRKIIAPRRSFEE